MDCIAIAQGYGLTLDTSLNKGNSSWANPVTASQNTQNDLLKRQLQESIMYYADDEYRESMGLSPLNLTRQKSTSHVPAVLLQKLRRLVRRD